jgi:hypothetical protein
MPGARKTVATLNIWSACVSDKPPVLAGGFRYFVSDEQLHAFAQLTPLQRLEWAEAAREFSLLGQTPETRERQERLRRGESIL